MIDINKIRTVVERELAGTDLFLVDIGASPSNVVEVTIDSDTAVAIEACVALSRAVESEFDRDTEDFELTVSSAGIGQPLKLERQYRKLIGKSVEVLLKSGVKILAKLQDYDTDTITLSYSEFRQAEGAKRKHEVAVVETYPLSQVKTTKEWLDFK